MDAPAEAGLESVLVEGVRTGEEDARWAVDPLVDPLLIAKR